MKKVFCLLSFLGIFSNSFSNNLDTNFENDTKNFRQENLLMEQKIRDNELKNFNPTDIKIEELEVNNENENKFLINNINITDSDNLLSFSEKDKVINKYINKELGASDIKNILMELTNKIVLKGYSTSSVGIRKNDLSTGILDLEIVAGKIEAVVFNEEDNLDKMKKFFLFSFKENDILNIRNIDTTSENFNYLQANNISIEILPGTKENYSIIKATNIMKDKFTIGLTTNNHGENYQDAFWRGGTYFNIDSPLGIGDNFYFSYTSVHKKDPDRSWKDVPDVPSPGEILPIGPKGYDPSKGDTFILGGTGVNDNSTILQRTNKFILASFVSINYDNLEKWAEKKGYDSIGYKELYEYYLKDNMLKLIEERQNRLLNKIGTGDAK